MVPKWQNITMFYHWLLKLALFAWVLPGNTQDWVPGSNLKKGNVNKKGTGSIPHKGEKKKKERETEKEREKERKEGGKEEIKDRHLEQK